MRYFPPILDGTRRSLVPMSSVAARNWVAALIAENVELQKDRFAQSLRDDPFFALWAALQLNGAAGVDFISEAVAWLCDFAPSEDVWASANEEFGDLSIAEAVARLFASTELAESDAQFFATVEAVERAHAAFQNVSSGADRTAKWLFAWKGVRPSDEDSLADALRPVIAQLARTGRILRDFNAALEREKLESMAEFAAGAGHEMNNPLAVISGRAQLLLKGETHPERRRDLALIHSQAMRVYEMIADMMLFARPPAPRKKRFAVQAWIRTIVEQFEKNAAEVGAKFRFSGPVEDFEIEADPTQLAVAVGALCQNAFEAIDDGGFVSLHVAKADGFLVVRTQDDGPGVTAEERRHIFDPYYSARQAGRGLGLGLSKTWRIAAMHGGSIETRNQPDGGAEFSLKIPLAACPK